MCVDGSNLASVSSSAIEALEAKIAELENQRRVLLVLKVRRDLLLHDITCLRRTLDIMNARDEVK